jgi:DNA invertase Pin-like site-specific DNA recombinase
VPPLRGGMSQRIGEIASRPESPPPSQGPVLEVPCFQQSHYFYRITVDIGRFQRQNRLCMTKAFAYLRVSGRGQEAGDGYTRQLQAISRYAAANEIKVVRVFKEGGVSGERELKDRPAFMEMLSALHTNGVRLILIERLDRLARSLYVQESIIAELKRHGFDLISVEEPDLMKDDPGRVMFRQFQGAIAQCEKANIVLKLRGARQRMKAKTGRCEGRKPYGATEGEQAIIARMRELRASGMAFDRIAATFNSDGVPTRTPGKRWHGFAVNQIFRRAAQPLTGYGSPKAATK